MGRRYYFHLIWTWCVITGERLTRAFWMAELSGILTLLSLYLPFHDAVRFCVMMCGVIVTIAIVVMRWNRFQMPNKTDVLRRIEHDNAIKHRAFSAHNDDYDTDSDEQERLVNLHRLKTHPAQFALKLTGHQPFFARHDPYGLRFIVLLLCFVTAFTVGLQWPKPIVLTLPSWAQMNAMQSTSNVSIAGVPPDYTHADAVSYTVHDDTITLPVGTRLTTTVKQKFGTPRIIFNEHSQLEGQFEQTKINGERIFTLFSILPEGIKTIRLKRFLRPDKIWDVNVIPDKPPTIGYQDKPTILPDGAMRIPMVTFDDYGLQTLRLIVRLDTDVDVPPIGDTIVVDRSIASKPNEPYEFAPVYDFTSHPWAGLPVIVMAVGLDGAHQPSKAHTGEIVLPEKPFQHPIAKDLIQMRKKLAWTWEKTDMRMVRGLNAYLKTPEKFAHDPVVYLALKTAAARLMYAQPTKDRAESVMALMWDIAITIENGALDVARQNVRMAQDKLEQIMRNPDATQDDISQAMQDLRQAMQTMMHEMMREMEKDGAPMLPADAFDTIIGSNTIDDIISEMEQAMRNGDTAKANDMMAKLQELMDQLQSAQMAEMPQDMQMMQKGQNALKELIDKQKTLREQTARQAGQSAPDFGDIIPFEYETMDDLGMTDMPPVPTEPNTNGQSVNTQANKTEQEALRLILGQLMIEAANMLDDIPEGMGLAEQEMRESSDALGANQPAESLPHQDQAIAYLEQAKQNLQQQLQQRMKQMGSMGLSMRQNGKGQGQGMQLDPLGRPYNPDQDGENGSLRSNVEIPDEAVRKRATEIMRELRNRSSDRTKPREALEYFERLMQWF